MNIDLQNTVADGVDKLCLAGRLDAASADELGILAGSGRLSGSLLVDCANLEFVDSVGLGAIVRVLRQVKANGGEMVLFGLTGPVRRTFEIARMHQVMGILDDEAAAFRWLA